MAGNNFKIDRIVFDDKALQKILKSQSVKAGMMKIGREIAKEVKAESGKRKYKYFVKAVTGSRRTIVYVGTDSPHAKYSEAKHGWLQAATKKKRGVISSPAKKPSNPRVAKPKEYKDIIDEDGYKVSSGKDYSWKYQ